MKCEECKVQRCHQLWNRNCHCCSQISSRELDALENLPFDEYELIWSHPLQILPTMFTRMLHGPGLTLPIRIFEGLRHTISLQVDGAEIAKSQRTIVRCASNGTPEIDDLVPPSE